MKIDKNIANLIAELEYKIGSQCYNPNSYNGYTGEEGCEFRYPIYTSEKINDEYVERKHYTISSLQTEEVSTLKYKFGSNHLYIGDGLVKVLECLEKRYHINFNELEEEYWDRINQHTLNKSNVNESVPKCPTCQSTNIQKNIIY